MRSTEIDAPVLVIAYGNELRRDDGAGPAAAEALRDQLPQQLADVRTVHQLLPELAEPLSRASLAIFIDADWSTPAGRFRKKNLIAETGGGVIGHHQSPSNLLRMARDLYGHAPPAILVQVGAADFGFREGLSRPVRRIMPQVVTEVIETIKRAARNPEAHYA